MNKLHIKIIQGVNIAQVEEEVNDFVNTHDVRFKSNSPVAIAGAVVHVVTLQYTVENVFHE